MITHDNPRSIDTAGVACEACAVPRLLIVPGLRGSDPAHWQSWLQRRHRRSVRAQLSDPDRPDLAAWSDDVGRTLAQEPPGPWIAVAHSFGGLAVLHHLMHGPVPRPGGTAIVGALLVAPASPDRHGVAALLGQRPIGVDLWVVSSSDDPWLPTHLALPWAARWGARLHDLGPAGHVNVASGFGRWPKGQEMVQKLLQRWHARHADEAAGRSPFSLREAPRPSGHLAGT